MYFWAIHVNYSPGRLSVFIELIRHYSAGICRTARGTVRWRLARRFPWRHTLSLEKIQTVAVSHPFRCSKHREETNESGNTRKSAGARSEMPLIVEEKYKWVLLYIRPRMASMSVTRPSNLRWKARYLLGWCGVSATHGGVRRCQVSRNPNRSPLRSDRVQFSSVQFSSVQDGTNAPLGKTHMRSTPSLRSFPNVAFVKPAVPIGLSDWR